ncbi:hypothetical protein Tsubulata_026445 [Turnera subulata]|uniref:Uncharacterized protein n=1 Tax=Turnera subulata TaxID=218843 RepID=A0A9Q0J0M7_9ROSI|nr:hypothetical protein Tsubulata_026445 [Turnera subulata]
MRLSVMAISDAVIGNLTTIYVAVIAGMKVCGLVCGRNFSGGFVLVASTTVVGLILVATLAWDVSRKATYAISRDHHIHAHEMCRGGICWHGVAVKSPASQVRFRLPSEQHQRRELKLRRPCFNRILSFPEVND